MLKTHTLIILVTIALGLLQGCATPGASAQLATQGRSDNTISAGTLATVGTCEMDVAADWTALAMSRQRAARSLRAKTITVQQALQVQLLADSARQDLEAACPSTKAQLDIGRRDAARATLRQIAATLEKKP